MAVIVRLIKVSNTETEKTLKLVLEYQEGEVSGGFQVYKFRRWLSDPEHGAWDQEEVFIEELSGVHEKEYTVPVGIPGSEEHGLRISFFDSGGVGHSIYPYEEDPSSPESSSDSSASPNGGNQDGQD
jgi:hypothetical protein